MYSSYQIANYFIKKSQDTGVELTPMKLIKLCYIAHGWYLALYDNQLLDESVVAWKYGPVIEKIYDAFRKYGKHQITELYTTGENPNDYPFPDKTIEAFLDKIWEAYGVKYNGLQLSTLTHQINTPWDLVWNKRGGSNKQSAIIPNDVIKEHYLAKISSSN